MTDIKTKLFRYKLPLTKSLNLKGSKVEYREGLILIFWSNDELMAFGEIVLLLGFSRETIEQAEEQLI